MTGFRYYESHRSVGAYRVDEIGKVWFPYGWTAATSGPPVVLAAGFSAEPDVYDDLQFDEIPVVLARRLHAPVMAGGWGTLGGSAEAFGNDDAIDAVQDGLDWLALTYGVSVAQVVMFGGSMGTLTTLNWGWRNVAKVIAAVVSLPAVNLENLYNEGTFATEIEEAYPTLAGSQSFTTPGKHDFTVPAGVTKLTVTIDGAEGGGTSGIGGTAGDGRILTGVMSVTPGEALDIYVGGRPTGQAGGSAGAASLAGGSGGDIGVGGPGAGLGGGAASAIIPDGGNKAASLIAAAGGGGEAGNGAGATPGTTVLRDISATGASNAGNGTNGGIGQSGGGGGGAGWQGGAGGAPNNGGSGGNNGYLPSRFAVAPTVGGQSAGDGSVLLEWFDPVVLDAHDPFHNADEITFPIRAYYGEADTLIPEQDVLDFVAAVGPNASAVSLGAVGHGTGLPSGLDMDVVCDWIAESL